MMTHQFSLITGLTTFFLVCAASSIIVAGQIPALKMKHMKGMLIVNGDRINSIYYIKKDEPGSDFLKIVYEGNPQGKEVRGTEATDVWQGLQQNKSFSELFLWVSHLGGTLGIPYRTIQSFYYTEPEAGTPARLRIVHDADSKVVDGPDAEAIWQNLQK